MKVPQLHSHNYLQANEDQNSIYIVHNVHFVGRVAQSV
jgi:hypothetical protein